MPKVIFQIEGGNSVEITCSAGDNLLELARRANVAIDAPCSGNGSCGKCRVQILEGQIEGQQTQHISDAEFAAGWCLSCCWACTMHRRTCCCWASRSRKLCSCSAAPTASRPDRAVPGASAACVVCRLSGSTRTNKHHITLSLDGVFYMDLYYVYILFC